MKGHVQATETVKAHVSGNTFSGHVSSKIVVQEIQGEVYDGPYTITPSAETQIIPIIGKTARQNITVDPIPSNYGLITWNGSTLTVS